MSEFDAALSEIHDLPPKEATLARVLVRNNICDAAVVIDAARAAAGNGGTGVLKRLVDAGALDAEQAKKVEETYERKLKEKRESTRLTAGAVSDDAREKRRTKRMWRPRRHADPADGGSQPSGEELITAGGGGDAPAVALPEKESGAGDDLTRFAESYASTSLHRSMLRSLLHQDAGVADAEAFMAATNASRAEVVDVLEQWKAAGLVKPFGPFPYYLTAHHDDQKRFARYLQLLEERDGRAAESEVKDVEIATLNERTRQLEEEVVRGTETVRQLKAELAAARAEADEAKAALSLKEQSASQLLAEGDEHKKVIAERDRLAAELERLKAPAEDRDVAFGGAGARGEPTGEGSSGVDRPPEPTE